MQKSKFRKGLVVAVIVLFVGASVLPSISGDKDRDIIYVNWDERQSEYKAGIFGFGANSNHNNPIVFRNISGKLITILNYDETQTLYSINHPSIPEDWEIIYDITMGTINYNHPDGLYINGNQDEWYLALYPDNISVENYTVNISVRFDLPHTIFVAACGIVFNYEDENNWYSGDLTICPNPYFRLMKYENGSSIQVSPYYHIPMVGGETYDLKLKVSNSEQEVRVYINNSAWNYIINLSEEPPEIVYIDDDYNETTPGWGYDHFDNIQDGVDAVNENGTVYVYNGTYYENVVIDKTINLIGEDRNNTIINGGSSGNVVYISVNGVDFSGFWIQSTGSYHDAGIKVKSNYSNISGNIINSSSWDCVWLKYSDYNIISDNIIYETWRGIILQYSSYNIISRNTISSMEKEGIFLEYEYSTGNHDNVVYHNNLIDNLFNAKDESNNSWDNGYPSGGNYWSDYTGDDLYSGPNQDIPGSDGIGDTPYNITGGDNQDLYPLMHPFEIYYILNISAPPEVNEGEMFNVVVTSMGGPLVPNATVEFNDELKLTGLDGRVYFTAPQVGEDTTYDIIANKDGYTGDTETILVKDVPVEFVSTFIFGRIDNLTTGGDVITFEAVNIRCVTFFPFTFNGYTSGELITISKNPFGFLGALFGVQLIFALCDASI